MHLELRTEKENFIRNPTFQGGGKALKALIEWKNAYYAATRANRGERPAG
jgi:hypothetical protein